jgi:hypothetical protein
MGLHPNHSPHPSPPLPHPHLLLRSRRPQPQASPKRRPPILIYITYYPLILLANLALHESHFITRPLDMFYCLFLSLVLSFLHQLTTLLGQYLLSTNGFTGTQHVAVHFSLLFWVLTEFEFYWTYIDFRDFEATRDAIKSAWKANIDTNFPVTRDPYGIGYIKTVIRDRIPYRKVALWTAQYYLFMFIAGY